jgi:AraC-like DNA-binding protein
VRHNRDDAANAIYRKLRSASQLLAQHGGNVTEVAYQAGFNNLSYFAKCFQRQFGVSPSAYAVSVSKTESRE